MHTTPARPRLRPRLVPLLLLVALGAAYAEDGAKSDQARAEELRQKAIALFEKGKFAEAREAAEAAESFAEKTLGPEHGETGDCLHTLATCLRQLGDLPRARAMYERALAIGEKVDGPDDFNTAAKLNALATCMEKMGDAAGAVPLFDRSVRIMERTRGARSRDAAAVLMNRAHSLVDLGRYRQARADYEHALEILEEATGPDSPDTALGLNLLAQCLQTSGEPKAAISLLRRALAIQEKALGVGHPYTSDTLHWIAICLRDLGDLKEARRVHERVLGQDEKAYGPEHPLTASSINDLAICLQLMGQWQEAGERFRRALAIRQKTLGPEHPETLKSQNNVASWYFAVGRFDEARAAFQRLLEAEEKVLPADHPTLADTMLSLARCLRHDKDAEGARTLCVRAVAIEERALGPDHPRTLSGVSSIAACLDDEGRFAEALPLLERAAAGAEKVLGETHPETAELLADEAECLEHLGEADKATALRERVWEANRTALQELLPALSTTERVRALAVRLPQLADCLSARGADPARSYDAALEWKGVALRLDAAGVSIAPDAPAEAHALARRLADERRELAHLALLGRTPVPGEVPLAEQVRSLSESVGTTERELSALLPGLPSFAFRGVRLADVQAALPEGAVLIDVLECCGAVHAWLVRRDAAPARFALGDAAELADLASGFREALERDDEAGWKAKGSALRARLAGPLDAVPKGTRTLVLSLDGGLASIPIGLLPDGEGLLVERYTIAHVGSGAGLVRASPARRAEDRAGLLTVGGVEYGGSGKPWTALAATDAEVEEVEARFKARTPDGAVRRLSGAEADEATFAREAPKARCIHAATHGYFDLAHLRAAFASAGARGISGRVSAAAPGEGPSPQACAPVGGWNPLLLSGIVLAGANEEREGGGSDGWLSAEELQSLDLRGCELVVLSACETGRGELAAGEGVLGLSRALAVAGAQRFMLSLWRVPDIETRQLMASFYDGLWKRGLPPEEALREAQLGMLDADRKAGRFRPSAWGAWFLTR